MRTSKVVQGLGVRVQELPGALAACAHSRSCQTHTGLTSTDTDQRRGALLPGPGAVHREAGVTRWGVRARGGQDGLGAPQHARLLVGGEALLVVAAKVGGVQPLGIQLVHLREGDPGGASRR